MTLLDQFKDLLRPVVDARLSGLDRAIFDALRDGSGDLATLRAERQALLGAVDAIVDGDRAALLAQWPQSLRPPPAWFADPSVAAELDPPGAPCVIECLPVASPADVEGGDEPPAPDLEAVRAERETFAREDYDRGVASLDRIVQTSKDPAAQTALAPAYAQLQADLVARLARISAAATVEELREL